jgi:dolichol-phosphate mannosyltransferase
VRSKGARRSPDWPDLGVGGLLLAQALAGARVVRRLLATRGGRPLRDPGALDARDGRASVVVPVLDEERRLGPCLEGLIAQGPVVAEILVVDGGSRDGTPALAARFAARDRRVRWIDASPVPADWNGKAWGLQVGLRHAAPSSAWLLTVDADVRPRPGLVRALVACARDERLASVSAATTQELAGPALGLLHPALLATLVYRFGSPGPVARTPADVQANGQCALFRRDALERHGGFVPVRASRCEDVTLARLLAAAGERVAFRETDGLAAARMYEDAGQAWRGWSRSLPMRDRFTRWSAPLRLAEATLAQAAPAWVLALGLARGALTRGSPLARGLLGVNLLLLVVRLGVLGGMARAYPARPWTYWLSPLADLPVVVRLWASMASRRHTWRGRALVADDVAPTALAGPASHAPPGPHRTGAPAGGRRGDAGAAVTPFSTHHRAPAATARRAGGGHPCD